MLRAVKKYKNVDESKIDQEALRKKLSMMLLGITDEEQFTKMEYRRNLELFRWKCEEEKEKEHERNA